MERPSASDGERAAAEWIAGRLRDEGARGAGRGGARPRHLLGAARAADRRRALAGAAAARGGRRSRAARRRRGRGGRGRDRRGASARARTSCAGVLPQRDTCNVVAEAGDPDAAETLVVVAHHDAAHGGLVFDQRFVTAGRRPLPRTGTSARTTSPQVMRLVVGGPALVALGALTGLRAAAPAGHRRSSLGSAARVRRHRRPPGRAGRQRQPHRGRGRARARAAAARGARRAACASLLVSTGSEESFVEGMRGFVRRHAAALPRERTRFVCSRPSARPSSSWSRARACCGCATTRPRCATCSPTRAAARRRAARAAACGSGSPPTR